MKDENNLFKLKYFTMSTLQISNTTLPTSAIQLIDIHTNGGPLPSQYDFVDQLIHQLNQDYENGVITLQECKELASALFETCPDTVPGRSLEKKYGYAGDFEAIDKIYQQSLSIHPTGARWDHYFHQHGSCKAVRNRKDYFKNLLKNRLVGRSQFNLLNVASGPARDLKELYQELNARHGELSTTCVDMDSDAIAFASQMTSEYSDQIEFVNKNAFKFRTEKKYDVIWSAGLFDYFNDKAFKLMLMKFRQWLKPGGEIVVGNFNQDHNPTRAAMEIIGDWFLNHRTEEQLRELARDAGWAKHQIFVGREPENVNLFLHLRSGN